MEGKSELPRTDCFPSLVHISLVERTVSFFLPSSNRISRTQLDILLEEMEDQVAMVVTQGRALMGPMEARVEKLILESTMLTLIF